MAQNHAQAPNRAWVGGNIGNPLIDELDEMHPSDLVVLELSSFQLELMTVAPDIAVILNITPNHLDRHGTMEAYSAAKARILEYQAAGSISVLNREDPGAWQWAPIVSGSLFYFGIGQMEPAATGSFVQGHILSAIEGVNRCSCPR